MSDTSNLRRQHKEILGLVLEINEVLKVSPPVIEQIGKLLPVLAGKINIHLAMEDKVLYPKLLSSGEAKIRQTAADFIAEMGDFTKVFDDYNKKWNSNLKVKGNFEEFNRETQMILTALTRRINREDQELYDLVDQTYN